MWLMLAIRQRVEFRKQCQRKAAHSGVTVTAAVKLMVSNCPVLGKMET